MVTQDRILDKYLERTQGEHRKRKAKRDKTLARGGEPRARKGRRTRRRTFKKS